jgi:hypothetical protein
MVCCGIALRCPILTMFVALAMGPLLLATPGCTAKEEESTDPFDSPLEERLPSDVRQFLENSERVVLYSIEGEGEAVPESTETSFHGFRILGKTELASAEQRQEILTALYLGIEEGGSPALCFSPRHGISAHSGHSSIDFVICFECMQLDVFGKRHCRVVIGESPRDKFNSVLTRSGVALATPPH